jgi:hypothetical protein
VVVSPRPGRADGFLASTVLPLTTGGALPPAADR